MSQPAADAPTHEELVASMTGGMTTTIGETFTGSDLLRSDGRPRPEFREQLRRIDDGRNALTVLLVLLAPVLVT